MNDAMDTGAFGAALRDATEDLDTRPGFIGDVLQGARRRQVRRRNTAALVIAVVVGVVGFGAGATFRDRPPPSAEVADSRLREPTKGDLAGEPDRVRAATDAWREGITPTWRQDRGVDELRGEPHVYWVGTTQAGPAAVVMQEAKITNAPGWRTMVGLVSADAADGRTKLVGSPRDSRNTADVFRFGPGDRTFLVVARDTPVFYSLAARWGSDGLVVRQWDRLDVTDGIGVLSPQGTTDPNEVRLVTSTSSPTVTKATGELEPVTASVYLATGGRSGLRSDDAAAAGMLPWKLPGGEGPRLEIGSPPRPALPADVTPNMHAALKLSGMADVGTTSTVASWSVIGGLPDGRSVVVSEFKDFARPSRVCLILYGTDGAFVRALTKLTDLASPLPVAIRVPDGQGWVVAAYGSELKYRTVVGGAWQDTTSSAALLPDDAVQVRVGEQVVDLPGE